jgi:hypothetical protein
MNMNPARAESVGIWVGYEYEYEYILSPITSDHDSQNTSQELARSPGNILDVLGVLLTGSPELGPELGGPKP